MLARSAFQQVKKQIDYSEYGGAPLLGVRGVTVIGHGRSNANAVKNAIRVANELAGANLTEKIEQELSIPAVRQHAQAGAVI
jgi:glycerol-3-phosphate acyltransferase PlsX